MIFEKLELDGLVLIKPNVFGDNRGYFFESFNLKIFEQHGIPTSFIQDNQSMSSKNVVRGLHFQTGSHAQGKLVRVIKGSVLDVVADINPDSKTFGRIYKVKLDAQSHHMLWIPPGYAHGFAALADNTIFSYKCTAYYNKESERGILFNDSDLNIDWEVSQPIVSEKDQELPVLQEYLSILNRQPYKK